MIKRVPIIAYRSIPIILLVAVIAQSIILYNISISDKQKAKEISVLKKDLISLTTDTQYLNGRIVKAEESINSIKFKEYVSSPGLSSLFDSSGDNTKTSPTNNEPKNNKVIVPEPKTEYLPTSDYIESYITSDFDGYDYGNIYKLANGQTWKQVVPYIYIYIWIMPKVIIYKDGLVYKMKVKDLKEITVERIG